MTQAQADNNAASLGPSLAEVIVEWDVTEDGAPFPPTAENIARLPFTAMKVFYDTIIDVAVPGVAEGNASSPSANAPSEDSAQSSPSFPNGSAGSTSPKLSASLSQT
jgi:hypothetical protein